MPICFLQRAPFPLLKRKNKKQRKRDDEENCDNDNDYDEDASSWAGWNWLWDKKLQMSPDLIEATQVSSACLPAAARQNLPLLAEPYASASLKKKPQKLN